MSACGGGGCAAGRNKQPIFDALIPWLTHAKNVLEVGAGDATHACYARERLPHATWQTSEAPAHHCRLVAALADHQDPGLPAPLALDVRACWPSTVFDAIYGANVAHIMDWVAVKALFAGASGHLSPQGLLCLYGPFLRAGQTPAPGNAEFDAALRARDPTMGLRAIDALDALAEPLQLVPVADTPMPSNNRLLIWRRRGVV